MSNSSSTSGLLYVALNGKEVTWFYLGINILTVLLGVLALSLNALVIDTLVRRGATQPVDVIMCHLATTDMLTGVLILYTVLYNLVNFQNQTVCLVRLGLMFTFVTCSMFQLTLLTVDRFVKIVFTYRYHQWLTNRTVGGAAAAIWVLTVNYGMLPAYGWRNIPDPSEPPCAALALLTSAYLRMGCGIICAPFVAICGMYVKISLVARRHARAIAVLGGMGSQDSTSMKFTKTVLILTGAYFVSFTPVVLISLIYTLGGFGSASGSDVGVYLVYTSVLVFCNSVVNPIIYAFKLPPVKKRLLRFLQRCKGNSLEQSTGQGSSIGLY